MTGSIQDAILPSKLQPGDRVCFVSPARLLGVPVLGGLPIGHGQNPIALPIGTWATMDVDAGVLTVGSGVR
jgi:hypothetical protein